MRPRQGRRVALHVVGPAALPVGILRCYGPQHGQRRCHHLLQGDVAGTLAGQRLQATLQPDGQGGHWLRVDHALQQAAGVAAGQTVALEIAPVDVEPEPVVPDDLHAALAAHPAARATWDDITAVARRDWIFWIVSGKKADTRVRRVATACDMLAAGKRRACCFDRSGMYSKSLAAPTPKAD
ncbi:YdeI/OmpD-associated family protein [Xanthomonas sp. NCPPB 1068]|uniref:YdeI/OmpD-associated family protein n=1 Tax=Xanthomonas sp. NCPPB 1068 TaxID=487525 RepID=UPI00355668F7